MTTIIEFKARPRPVRERLPSDGETATLLFFTGVRYERREADGRAALKAEKPASGRRDGARARGRTSRKSARG